MRAGARSRATFLKEKKSPNTTPVTWDGPMVFMKHLGISWNIWIMNLLKWSVHVLEDFVAEPEVPRCGKRMNRDVSASILSEQKKHWKQVRISSLSIARTA